MGINRDKIVVLVVWLLAIIQQPPKFRVEVLLIKPFLRLRDIGDILEGFMCFEQHLCGFFFEPVLKLRQQTTKLLVS